MLIHLSEQSSETLQEQIREQIRARILNGDLATDFALPSIRSLATDLRVSVITVQRAYEALLNEGVIYARRGKGYFVANLPDKDRTALASQRFHAQLEKLLASARQDGLSEAEIKQLFGKAMKAGE